MVLEFSGEREPRRFMAGAGRAVITPPAGYPICGPEHAERRSTGVADDLLAKVLVVESDRSRAAVISLDVWGLSESIRSDITRAVAGGAGIPNENAWICVTGNGTSPCLWDEHVAYGRYATYLPDMVGGAAAIAVQSLAPASIAVGAARLPDVSTSVEGPGRPGDDALFTVSFNGAAGEGIGQVVNFSCPATVRGSCGDWTADYPGYAMWAVEQSGGGLSLFAQGASADLRPFDWYAGNPLPSHSKRSASDVQALGLLLATQAARSTVDAVPRRNATIVSALDASEGLNVLRIGPAVFVSSERPQPARFARHIRRDLPGSTAVVSANLRGDAFGSSVELDHGLQRRAVELARQTGAS